MNPFNYKEDHVDTISLSGDDVMSLLDVNILQGPAAVC